MERYIRKYKCYDDKGHSFRINRQQLGVVCALAILSVVGIYGVWWVVEELIFPYAKPEVWVWPVPTEAEYEW